MKVLFVMRSTIYVRNFESTLRLLCERGHHVHVVAETHQVFHPSAMVDGLAREYPSFRHTEPKARRLHDGAWTASELRRGLDFLRYLERDYDEAPKLRRRALQKAPSYMLTPAVRRITATRAGRTAYAMMLKAGERAAERDPAVDAFVRDERPDLVLVTPLVEQGSPQSAYTRAGQAIGARTGLCVFSWDNLTNKGLIHDRLDVVTVWNHAMKQEAVRLHGVPADRVVVTGAPGYDHWFTWTPCRTREAFCAEVGLDPSRPYFLYLCSSQFIAPHERPFIRRWIAELRASSPALANAGVLVRPHPQNMSDWLDGSYEDIRRDLGGDSGSGTVAVWPRQNSNPVDVRSRGDYFDSIFHSAAVVGVNTSAQIESAIVGRGVYTVLAPEFAETQQGTLHFQHLSDPNDGVLRVAADMGEHAAQLEAALARPDLDAARCRRFVKAFVRPQGIGIPSTPRLVDALEAVVARGPARPSHGPWWRGLAQPMLRRAAAAIDAAERRAPQRRRPRLI